MAPQLIKADLLIPGIGAPLEKAALLYEAGRILWVGSQSEVKARYHAIEVPVLLPGLWDAHVHFFGTRAFSFTEFYSEPRVRAGARIARDLAEVLNAGFTSVRELGGYGLSVAKAVEEGYLAGPTIYAAGSIISMTGGHGDGHEVALDAYEQACTHGGLCFELCDGVDGCVRAVRKQLRQGADVIKICTSGGVASHLDDPHCQQFSDAEIRAMVDEARRARRIVASHCHGTAGILAAIRGGVTTIEHGSFLTPEAIDLMKARGVILVPTRTIVEGGLQLAEKWSPSSFQKMEEVARAARESYATAIKSGVKIALGSDLGFSQAHTKLSHGFNASEMFHAVEAGMTPLQAIEAATAMGPLTLGPRGPLSGQLREGYDADFIALTRSPVNDISVFQDIANITHVWKAGKVVKSPQMSAASWSTA